MNYERFSDGVILSGYDSFDIEETLECGQCFRFERLGEKEYSIVAKKKALYIKQDNDTTFFSPCSVSEFENIWLEYFDLNRDYLKIKNTLMENDKEMRKAIEFGKGIRILNQERIETIISFIISQNKQIAGIKKIIRDMSERYGEYANGYYSFPDIEVLASLGVLDYAGLKTGFRAKYIADAVKKIYEKEIDINPPDEKTTDEIRAELMKINGVGPKVANCILLFSFGRRESFPVDVWVRRAVEDIYFPGANISLAEMQVWAKEKFGEHGGYAQQYLFYYMRNIKK